MIAPTIALGAASAVSGSMSAMATAIQGLYGMTVAINVYLDNHIEEMKSSDNATVSRTGRVIEMAKFGFGIGYVTPVVIIATGQLLLGNTLAAIGTVATAATLTNPIAMTCAAVGAIYYGWGALSGVEQGEILEKLSRGLNVGIELIRSIVRFVIDKAKELLSSKNLDEIKKFIAATAQAFGKSLSDVTHKLSDVVSDGIDTVKEAAEKGIDKAGDVASEAYESAKSAAQRTAARARNTIAKVKSGDKAATDGVALMTSTANAEVAPKAVLLAPRKTKGKARTKK